MVSGNTARNSWFVAEHEPVEQQINKTIGLRQTRINIASGKKLSFLCVLIDNL
jgi:hypothetical protein